MTGSLVSLGMSVWAKDLPDHDPLSHDLLAMPLESLLEMRVSGASRFAQKSIDAPATVSIITAADIRAFGYRTLADILRSVRGLYTSYDRNYAYLGVRGFGRSGDYNSRMLILVDGYRVNEPIFDQGSIDTSFQLDVDLIERVEIVRGPGSSVYGSNAVFGIINIITRSGEGMDGAELAGAAGSHGTDAERISAGGRLDNGLDWLLSGSRYHSEGGDLYFPEFDTPASNNGIAENLDGDRSDSVFGKLSYGNWTLIGGYSSRKKNIPTASYETVFDDPREWTRDTSGFADLAYSRALASAWKLDAHVSYGDYAYDGSYPYEGTPTIINRDESRGQWWSTEARLVGRLDRHKLVAGIEYQDNFHQNQFNGDISPAEVYIDERHDSQRTGIYLQDEISLTANLLFNAGARYDHYSTVGDTFNPRLALIWHATQATTLKALYGTAFRAPNAYELYYLGDTPPGNTTQGLDSENISSYELIAEHHFHDDFRVIFDVFYNHISNVINTSPGADGFLIFANTGAVNVRGLELEAEYVWSPRLRLRASYSWQFAEESHSGTWIVNSPRNLAKVNLLAPIFGDALNAGLELQYTGSRKALAGTYTGSTMLCNLNFTANTPLKNLEISAGIYNLFNHDYADPAGDEHLQDMIPQDGRNFRLKFDFRF